MPSSLLGIHHVTAIASDPQTNIDFYTSILGLRLVKKTVNFDDPESYHLYYGDETGRPGSVLTFFCWPRARRGSNGNGQISATSFLIRESAMSFWKDRLQRRGIAVTEATRFGEKYLGLEDPDGLALELVASPLAESQSFCESSSVASDFAIRGLHGVTVLEEDNEPTEKMLREGLGFSRVMAEGGRFRYQIGTGNSIGMLDVVCSNAPKRGQIAVGSIHHVAWRVEDQHQLEWKEKIAGAGHHVSPVMDRQYFRSIYFREPGGVLFEIATDGPGFLVDEPVDQLGQRLCLPTWLEYMRTELEQRLPRLQVRRNDSNFTELKLLVRKRS